MRGGPKRSILIFIFIALVSVALPMRPASAMTVEDNGAYVFWAKMIAEAKEQLSAIKDGFDDLMKLISFDILGDTGTFKRLVPDGTPGSDELPWVTTKPTSLVDYFEKVFFPRLVMMMQMQTRNEQQFQAVSGQLQSRMIDAQTQVQSATRAAERQVDNTLKVLGTAEVACPYPSMTQSALAAEVARNQIRKQVTKYLLDQTMGNKKYPDYAKGPVQYDMSLPNKRKSLKTCDPEGADGADKAWCDNTDTANINKDLDPDSLVGGKLLQDTDPVKDNYTPFADLYIENLFPRRSFSPLRQDLMKGPNPPAAEILTDRTSYATAMATFQRPFSDAKAERTGLPDMAALPVLTKMLIQAGFEGDQADDMYMQAKTSLAAMDYIRYKVFYMDPQTVIKNVAGSGALSWVNVLVFQATTMMNAVTLLYDIREEIKHTNRLLGAIGGFLSKEQFDVIQAKTQALSAGN